MNKPAANLSVCVGDKVACIKIAGRASFNCSVDFKTLINGLWQKGYVRFILDLSDCLLMDSTFLGVLAGLGLKFSTTHNGDHKASIGLLNPNARISDLLENLGVNHLFTTTKGSAPEIERLVCLEQAQNNPDRSEVTRTCLEAHQTLMDINPANIPKFKDVARFLAEDLQNMDEKK